MSAASLAASPSTMAVSSRNSTFPDALRQFLYKIEEQRNVNPRISEDLYRLKSALENRWRIASSEGRTSSTTLYEVLRYGWKEWQRITAQVLPAAS